MLEKMHLLVVDDDSSLLDSIETILQSMKVGRLTRAISGKDAYQKWYSSPRVVDCVLSDCRMADGNGLQLLQAVRTAQIPSARPDTCFILMTAKADPNIVSAAVSLDVNGFLIKPINHERLFSTVKKGRSRAFKVEFHRYQRVSIPPLIGDPVPSRIIE